MPRKFRIEETVGVYDFIFVSYDFPSDTPMTIHLLKVFKYIPICLQNTKYDPRITYLRNEYGSCIVAARLDRPS